jgi:hypothetical protein
MLLLLLTAGMIGCRNSDSPAADTGASAKEAAIPNSNECQYPGEEVKADSLIYVKFIDDFNNKRIKGFKAGLDNYTAMDRTKHALVISPDENGLFKISRSQMKKMFTVDDKTYLFKISLLGDKTYTGSQNFDLPFTLRDTCIRAIPYSNVYVNLDSSYAGKIKDIYLKAVTFENKSGKSYNTEFTKNPHDAGKGGLLWFFTMDKDNSLGLNFRIKYRDNSIKEVHHVLDFKYRTSYVVNLGEDAEVKTEDQ